METFGKCWKRTFEISTNAKELILNKINAGADLASMYIYLTSMGIPFVEASKFMMNPVVEAIVKKGKSYIFDPSTHNNNVKNAVNYFKNGVAPKEFLSDISIKFISRAIWKGIAGNDYISFKDYLEKNAKETKLEDLFKEIGEDVGYMRLSKLLSYKDTSGEILRLFDEWANLYLRDGVRFKEGAEDAYNVKKRKKNFNADEEGMYDEDDGFEGDVGVDDEYEEDQDEEEFDDDLNLGDVDDEESSVSSGAKVTAKQQLNRMLDNVRERLEYMKIPNFDSILMTFEAIKKGADELTLLGKRLGINQGIGPDLESMYKYDRALEVKLMEPFKDKPEDELDTPDYRLANSFSAKKFFSDKNYAEKVIDLYERTGKHTFNIFDAIHKIPHFYAMQQVAGVRKDIASLLSIKFRTTFDQIVDTLHNEIGLVRSDIKNTVTLKGEQIKGITGYVDDVLLSKWLKSIQTKENPIRIDLFPGMHYFDNYGKMHIVADGTKLQNLDLSTTEGRATFKLYMEQVVIESLKNDPNLKGNSFIQDLVLDSNKNLQVGGEYTYYKLPIDMSNIKTENDLAIFNKYAYDFEALKYHSHELGSTSIVDLLFLYNTIVHRNRFGSNSFLKFFDSILASDKKSLAAHQLSFIGNYDMSYEDFKQGVDFSMDDLLRRIAPKLSIGNVLGGMFRGKYVKAYDPKTQVYNYYKWEDGDEKGKYVEFSEGRDRNKTVSNYFIFNLDEPGGQEVFKKDPDMTDILTKLSNNIGGGDITINLKCN